MANLFYASLSSSKHSCTNPPSHLVYTLTHQMSFILSRFIFFLQVSLVDAQHPTALKLRFVERKHKVFEHSQRLVSFFFIWCFLNTILLLLLFVLDVPHRGFSFNFDAVCNSLHIRSNHSSYYCYSLKVLEYLS